MRSVGYEYQFILVNGCQFCILIAGIIVFEFKIGVGLLGLAIQCGKLECFFFSNRMKIDVRSCEWSVGMDRAISWGEGLSIGVSSTTQRVQSGPDGARDGEVWDMSKTHLKKEEFRSTERGKRRPGDFEEKGG